MMAMHETIQNATAYDELMGGPEIPVLTKNVTLKRGTAYKRGMLLTAKTSQVSATAKGEVADYVLANDTDATGGDTIAMVYVSGRFNREKLIAAEGDTVDAHEAELRDKNIYLTSLK